MLGYRFDIVNKPGLENKGADALSRMHETTALGAMLHYPEWIGSKEVVEEVHKDAMWLKIIADLQEGNQTKPGFAYRSGVLFYENRLVIAANSRWILILLHEFHSTPQGGHSGVLSHLQSHGCQSLLDQNEEDDPTICSRV